MMPNSTVRTATAAMTAYQTVRRCMGAMSDRRNQRRRFRCRGSILRQGDRRLCRSRVGRVAGRTSSGIRGCLRPMVAQVLRASKNAYRRRARTSRLPSLHRWGSSGQGTGGRSPVAPPTQRVARPHDEARPLRPDAQGAQGRLRGSRNPWALRLSPRRSPTLPAIYPHRRLLRRPPRRVFFAKS
jgi:hypothetical protein